MMLNEMKEDFRKLLAPTDSRFRTDIKQLELGDLGNFLYNYLPIIKMP